MIDVKTKSFVIALLGFAVLWFLQILWRQFMYRRYLHDHPHTIRMDQYYRNNHRGLRRNPYGWWERAARTIMHGLWTLLSLLLFGGCAAFGLVGTVIATWIWNALLAIQAGLSQALGEPRNDPMVFTPPTASSGFILAPTASSSFSSSFSSSKPSVRRKKQEEEDEDAPRATKRNSNPTQPVSNNKSHHHRVSFSEHSNGQIRHTQFSYDPHTLQTPASVQESKTPPPRGTEDPTLQPNSSSHRQVNNPPTPPKHRPSRFPHTPPLPRKGRSYQHPLQPPQHDVVSEQHRTTPTPSIGEKENQHTPRRTSNAYAISRRTQQEYSSGTRPNTGASEPAPSTTSIHPIRNKRPAPPNDPSNEYSPAVKRMYGRLRLPNTVHLMGRSTTTTPLGRQEQQQQILVADRKLKRRREQEKAIWEAFQQASTSTRHKTLSSATNVDQSAIPPTVLPPSQQGPDAGSQPEDTSQHSRSNLTAVGPAPALPTFRFGSSTTETSVLPPEPAAALGTFQFGVNTNETNNIKKEMTAFQFGSNVGTTPSSTNLPADTTSQADSVKPLPTQAPVFRFGSNAGSDAPPIALASSDEANASAVLTTQPSLVPDPTATSGSISAPATATATAPSQPLQPAFQFGSTPTFPAAPIAAAPASLQPPLPPDANTLQPPSQERVDTTASAPGGFKASAAIPPPTTTFQFGSNPTQTPTQDAIQQLSASSATPAFQFGSDANKTPSAGGAPSTGTPAFQFGSPALIPQPPTTTTFTPSLPPAHNPFAALSAASGTTPTFQFGTGTTGTAAPTFGIGTTSTVTTRRRGTPQTRRRR